MEMGWWTGYSGNICPSFSFYALVNKFDNIFWRIVRDIVSTFTEVCSSDLTSQRFKMQGLDKKGFALCHVYRYVEV